MRNVPVEEAQVGDRVVEAVYNEKGRVLLPVGSRLSQAVLSRLRGWGVDSIAIQREGGSSDEQTRTLIAALDHCFIDHEEDALMMRIKDAARSHLEQRR